MEGWFPDKPFIKGLGLSLIDANINKYDTLLELFEDEKGNIDVKGIIENMGGLNDPIKIAQCFQIEHYLLPKRIQRICLPMLSKDKIEKFRVIARDLYTKEYIGIDGYGNDPEYEDKLTDAAANYLMATFYDYANVGKAKEEFMEILSQKSPQYPSKLLSIIL